MRRRVAIYARVSTKDLQEPDNQIHPLQEWAQAQGYQVVRVYIDRESGGSSKRPEFELMMLHAHQGQFDLLLFWSLDRLSREGALATLQHLQKLDQAKVAWRSHMESYLDSSSPLKDVVIALLGTLAKMEKERISERVKAGMARAKRQGKKMGRKALMLDGQQLQDYRDQGLSLEQIGRKVGCSGVSVLNHLRAFHERKAQRRVASIPNHQQDTNHQTPSLNGSMNGAQASREVA
jgi:DNA invertase Pin-like site-specific DNA recombinase